MPDQPIFLDNLSTTPVDPRVAAAVADCLTQRFGNPSSVDHIMGDEADTAVRQASQHVAALLGTGNADVVFTSGATESINLGIKGFVRNKVKNTNRLLRIACLAVEHKAVLDVCRSLEDENMAQLQLIPVDNRGRLDLGAIENILRSGLDLLCVMAANNEIGNIYPAAEVTKLASAYDTPVFCDATQAVGKIPVAFDRWECSLLAASAHKIYGPKGVGVLVVKRGIKLSPIMHGGEQQNGLRPGTLNVPGIVAFGEACRLRKAEMAQDEAAIAQKRDRLQGCLREDIPGFVVNGDTENRLAGCLHFSVPGIPNKTVIARLRDRLCISTGSACSSGLEGPSHVLDAMGMNDDLAESAFRVAIGKFNSESDVQEAAKSIAEAVSAVRQTMLKLSSLKD